MSAPDPVAACAACGEALTAEERLCLRCGTPTTQAPTQPAPERSALHRLRVILAGLDTSSGALIALTVKVTIAVVASIIIAIVWNVIAGILAGSGG